MLHLEKFPLLVAHKHTNARTEHAPKRSLSCVTEGGANGSTYIRMFVVVLLFLLVTCCSLVAIVECLKGKRFGILGQRCCLRRRRYGNGNGIQQWTSILLIQYLRCRSWRDRRVVSSLHPIMGSWVRIAANVSISFQPIKIGRAYNCCKRLSSK
jgi:hypothetical protein